MMPGTQEISLLVLVSVGWIFLISFPHYVHLVTLAFEKHTVGSFYINLTQAIVTWEKKISVEKIEL